MSKPKNEAGNGMKNKNENFGRWLKKISALFARKNRGFKNSGIFFFVRWIGNWGRETRRSAGGQSAGFLARVQEEKMLEDKIRKAREKLAELYAEEETKEPAKKSEEKKEGDKPEAALGKELVLVSKIAVGSVYSKNYLSYAARLGTLKAEKVNGNWSTTKEWLSEFTQKNKERRSEFQEKLSSKLTEVDRESIVKTRGDRRNEIENIKESIRELEANLSETREKIKAERKFFIFCKPVLAGLLPVIIVGVFLAWKFYQQEKSGLMEKIDEVSALNIQAQNELLKKFPGLVMGEESADGQGSATGGWQSDETGSWGAQDILSVLNHDLTYEHIAEHKVRRWNLNKNAVNSKKIVDYSVEARDLSNNAVNSRSIENKSVHSRDLADDIRIRGNLTVEQTAYFHSDVEIDGTLTIGSADGITVPEIHTDAIEIGGGYGNTGTTIDSNGNISTDGNLIVGGTSTFNDALTVTTGGASITGNTTITGNAAISGDIDAATGTIATLDGTTITYATGNFTTANITTGNIVLLDLGTNTITDGNFTGNWNFNAGNLTSINALTVGTANITTIDLGTNTITDGNFTGNWDFNAGALSGTGTILPDADMFYDLGSPGLRWANVYAGTLIIGGTTVSGQAIFTYQPVTTAITQASVYINPAAAIADAPLFGMAVNGDERLRIDEDGDLTTDGVLTINGAGNNYFAGNVGIGTTNPLYKLDVNGDARIQTLAAGATNDVITQAAGVLQTRTIDSRVWGATLVDYSGTNTNYIAKFSDADTLTQSVIYETGGNIGIGTTNPLQKLHVEGQCVTGDTLLAIAGESSNGEGNNARIGKGFRQTSPNNETGFETVTYKRIDQVKGGEEVLSLDEKTGKLVPAKIKGLLDMGVKPIFKITTEDGRTIRTTGNHPYLTKQGWQKIANLNEGKEIAVPELFVPQRRIDNDGDGQKNQGADNVESGHRVEIKNHDITLLMMNNERIHDPKESESPEKANPSFVPIPVKNGTTIEAKNTKPILDSVSATSFNWESESLMSSEYNSSESDVKTDSDIKFVKIKKIEMLPAEQVWDIEVEGTHNFVANGIIAHNTYINGNVGIGVSVPSYRLDIADSTTTRGLNIVNSTALSYGLYSVGTQYGVYGSDGTTSGYLGYDDTYGLYTANNAYIGGTLTLNSGLTMNGNLLPDSDNDHDLGSATARWHDLYVGPGSVKVYNTTGANAEYMTLGFAGNIATLNVTKDAAGNYRDLALNQNGSETLRITGGNIGIGTSTPGTAKLSVMNGNVGIGTTNPTYALDVLGASTNYVRFSDTAGRGGIRLGNGTNQTADIVFSVSGSNNLSITTNYSSSSNAIFLKPAGTFAMSLFGSGNVGIGTTNPTQKLQVGTTLYVDSSNGRVGIGIAPTAVTLDVNGTTYLRGTVFANAVAGFFYGGAVGFESGRLNLTAPAGGIISLTNGNVGIGTSTPGTAGLAVMGGNVGIGTTSPNYTLSVISNGGTASQTAFFQDATPTTGNTSVVIKSGAVKGTYLNIQNSSGTTIAYIGDWFGNSAVGATYGFFSSIAVGGQAVSLPNTYRLTWGSTSDAMGTIDSGFSRLGAAKLALGNGTNADYSGTLIAGNVGIGLTGPTDKLDVAGGVKIGAGYAGIGTTAPVNGLLVQGNVGIGTTAPTNLLDVAGGVKIGAGYAGIGTTAPVNGMLVQGNVGIGYTGSIAGALVVNGNVGIGTTSPLYKLDVNGNARIQTLAAGDTNTVITHSSGVLQTRTIDSRVWGSTLVDYSGTNTNYLAKFSDADTLTQSVIYETGGNVGIGTTAPGNKLSVSGGVGIGTTAPGSLYLSTAAPDGGLIVENKIGIGTTGPAQALDVTGMIRYTLEDTDAANNYVCYNAANKTLSDCTSLRKYKEHVSTLGLGLETVMKLNPVEYTVKSSGEKTLGFIAEEVEAVSPLLATYKDGELAGVKMPQMSALLTRAVQEQQTEISNVKIQMTNEIQNLNDKNINIDDKLKIISNAFANLDARTTANETGIANLKTKLSTAETKLQQSENNLATFEIATNDTLSTMIETENMLTQRVLNHEDRLKALEDKMATLSVSGGEVPDNVITQDLLGNVDLKGILSAKGVVAGAYAVKNDSAEAPTAGEGKIETGKTEVVIRTAAVKENSKIFVTSETELDQSLAVVEKKAGESFIVKLKRPAEEEINFDWWILDIGPSE